MLSAGRTIELQSSSDQINNQLAVSRLFRIEQFGIALYIHIYVHICIIYIVYAYIQSNSCHAT